MSAHKTIAIVSLLTCWISFSPAALCAADKKPETPDDEKTVVNKQFVAAASSGQVDKLKELLQKGADLHYRNPADNGKTAMSRAVLMGHLAAVKFLLENGADIHYPDGSGRYPVYFCLLSTDTEMLTYLLEKGGAKDINLGPFPIIPSLCGHGQGTAAMIPMLVKAGADVNAFNERTTALIAAINLDPKVRKPEVSRAYVKALIESKADVNLKDKREKMSPLQWAKKSGDKEIIEMLENAGAKE